MSEVVLSKGFESAVQLLGYEPMRDEIMDVASLFLASVANPVESTQEEGVFTTTNRKAFKRTKESSVVPVGPYEDSGDSGLSKFGFDQEFLEIELIQETKHRMRPFIPASLGNLAVGSEESCDRWLRIKNYVGNDEQKILIPSFEKPYPVGRESVWLDTSTQFATFGGNREHIEKAAELLGKAIEINCPEVYTPVFRTLDFYKAH